MRGVKAALVISTSNKSLRIVLIVSFMIPLLPSISVDRIGDKPRLGNVRLLFSKFDFKCVLYLVNYIIIRQLNYSNQESLYLNMNSARQHVSPMVNMKAKTKI
jgi:hypothetical protein